jgi:hypothetical protein
MWRISYLRLAVRGEEGGAAGFRNGALLMKTTAAKSRIGGWF